MSIQCRCCRASLPTPPKGGYPPESPESLGICPQCADTLHTRLGVSLDEFQSESGPVVVVLSGDVQVVDASFGAVGTLEDDDDGDTLIGRLAGEVFGCENAERPGGCGATPDCGKCTVRRAVTSTWESGKPQTHVSAALRVTSHRPRTRVSMARFARRMRAADQAGEVGFAGA